MDLKYTTLPNIDTLITLAKEQPEELERIRVKLTQELIDNAPSTARKRRLEGLNFTIEMKRKSAKNPLHGCIKISELMWDSAVDLAGKIKRH